MITSENRKTIFSIWQGIQGILILIAVYFGGEWLARFIPFPVPGSVLGLVLIFALLQFRILPLDWVDRGAIWLLAFLGLFYVPYGVGIVKSGPLVAQWGWQILIIIVVTVLSVFAFSSWMFVSLKSRDNRKHG